MATRVEFLRDYGVEIRANGQKRWPDEVKVRVPRDDGHRFHGMMGTDSTRSWAVISRDRGQV